MNLSPFFHNTLFTSILKQPCSRYYKGYWIRYPFFVFSLKNWDQKSKRHQLHPCVAFTKRNL